jgi:hypothetical protein
VTRNALQRYQECGLEKFQNTKAFKKLSKIYFPIDREQLELNPGFIPRIIVPPPAPKKTEGPFLPEDRAASIGRALKFFRKSSQQKKVAKPATKTPALALITTKNSFKKEDHYYNQQASTVSAKLRSSIGANTPQTPSHERTASLRPSEGGSIPSPYRDYINRLSTKKEK